MTAEEILKLIEPERLFPNDKEEAAKTFKKLALEWHPDRNKNPFAAKVMAQIASLYQQACNKLEAGTWAEPGVFTFKGEGKIRKIKYVRRHSFELGELFIGNKMASFVVGNQYDDYVIRGLRAVGSIRYPKKEWKTDLEQYFPKVEKLSQDETHNAQVISVLKDENALLLQDLIDYQGKIDPKHTAWIISSLLNICSFLSLVGITHNGLAPGTVFVSPSRHCVYLLGGWWYSVENGKELKTVPAFSHRLMISIEKGRKLATPRLDLECVKEIGRLCVGEALKDLPKPYIEFLKFPASANALDEYANWEKTLKDSYGARRFIKLDVTPSAVYGG